MATELGEVGGSKVVKKGKLSDGAMGYILENGMEIVDTFAETCCHTVITRSVLGKPLFFQCHNSAE